MIIFGILYNNTDVWCADMDQSNVGNQIAFKGYQQNLNDLT